jgi:hypothetical protein
MKKFSLKEDVLQEFSKNPEATASKYGMQASELGDLKELKGLNTMELEQRLLKTRFFSMFDFNA